MNTTTFFLSIVAMQAKLIIMVLTMTMLLGERQALAQMGASDPCPTPQQAIESTPNSMAKIQEDIDRFVLCVERAQLLNRLNSLVENNTETIDSVLLQPTALPPLPVASDGSAPQDFSNVPNASGNGGNNSAPAPISESSLQGGIPGDFMEEDTDPVWLIREIFGSSGRLQARVISSEGKLATVRQGDMLSDEIRVVEISTTSMKINQEDEIIDLEWVNDDAAAGE